MLVAQKEKNAKLKVISLKYKNNIFLNTHGVLNTRSSLNTLLKAYCKKYNVDVFSMHSLRHTYATWCIEAGIRPKTFTGNPWTFEHNNNNEPLRPCDRRSKRKGDFEVGKLPKSGVIGTELVQNYITK